MVEASPDKGAAFFRSQATDEGTALEETALHWTKVAEDASLEEVLRGEIRAVVGQAKLLHSQRVEQFLGLCDLCKDGPNEEDGLTARAADLEGFWEVIMMQVRDTTALVSCDSDLTEVVADSHSWRLGEQREGLVCKA